MTVKNALSGHLFRHSSSAAMLARAGLPGWLAGLGREVGLDLAGDSSDRSRELEIYRAAHALSARSASPIALAALAYCGLDEADALDQLRPDLGWPGWFCGSLPRLFPGGASLQQDERFRKAAVTRRRAQFLHGPTAIPVPGTRPGELLVRLSPDGLDAALTIGSARVVTRGSAVTISTRQQVPETVKAAVVGRPVGDLFSHPVLDGSGLTITRVRGGRRVEGRRAGRWAVVCESARVDWSVPASWAPIATTAELGRRRSSFTALWLLCHPNALMEAAYARAAPSA